MSSSFGSLPSLSIIVDAPSNQFNSKKIANFHATGGNKYNLTAEPRTRTVPTDRSGGSGRGRETQAAAGSSRQQQAVEGRG